MALRPLRRLTSLLHGPPVALPRWLDQVAESWAGLAPRSRLVIAGLALAVAVAAGEARVLAAEQRWGGPAIEVLVATSDLPTGARPDVRAASVPPALAPAQPASAVPDDARLALPLPEGAVLTTAHLDPRGPAAGLDPELRVLPLDVETGWGVTAGGWVDVWVLGVGDEPAQLVAERRPVVALDVDDAGRTTALVGVADHEVGPTTTGVAVGRVLLSHAPRP